MKPFGVIVNARAGAVRRDPGLVERLRGRLSAAQVHATACAVEIDAALDALRALGIDTLVVVGGDGSVGGTLTRLLARWPEAELPAVVIAPGGTVNTISRSLGARGSPERLIERLVAGGPPRVDTRRPLVRARAADGETHDGMVFAAGAAVRWLRLYYEAPRQGPGPAAALVARVVGSASVRGRLAQRVFEPCGVEVTVDGRRLELGCFTALVAASVREIGLGFRPFLTAGRDPERFHLAITDAGPARLSLELPALQLGLGGALSCLHHHSARRVSLHFAGPEPWSVDADVYAPTAALELVATHPLRFLVP